MSCSGHAYPAGAFLLMAADVRLGADGPFRLGLNEVRLGLTLPLFATVLARHRLSPAAFDHAAVTGTLLDPHGAPTPGSSMRWSHLTSSIRPPWRAHHDLASLDRRAHGATKRRVRRPVIDELRAAIDAELG